MNPSRRISKTAHRMMSLIEEINPLPRLINSPGLDKTFEIIKREIPAASIDTYPSGMVCEDWIVPEKWHLKDAVMKDASGSVVASIEDSPLFVAPYSEPVEGWFSKAEIATHLRTRPDRPDAFALEHRHAYDYRLNDWGITLPDNRWKQLNEEKYYIKIDIDRQPGDMKVAEYLLPGRSPQTLCICAHIDELCNDNLSGCAVAVELMRFIETLKDRRFSYQMLLVPEMFGSLCYAYSNPQQIENTFAMLNLEALGVGDDWVLKHSIDANQKIDKLLAAALEAEGTPFKEIGFFEGYGNDERVYSWPGINIPGVSLQRFPFKEYHTSEDTPALINPDYLLQALQVCKTFVRILDQDYIPRYTKMLPPWLTRSGLYFDAQNDPVKFQKFNNQVLYNLDGNRTVFDLAEIAGLDFFEVHSYLDRFLNKDYIEKIPVS